MCFIDAPLAPVAASPRVPVPKTLSSATVGDKTRNPARHPGRKNVRRRSYLAAAVVLVLALTGCGDDPAAPPASKGAAPVRTTTAPAPKFSTANPPGLDTSPQETYDMARGICGAQSARKAAADFRLSTSDPAAIARRYARGYVPPLRAAALVGCREGLAEYAKAHP